VTSFIYPLPKSYSMSTLADLVQEWIRLDKVSLKLFLLCISSLTLLTESRDTKRDTDFVGCTPSRGIGKENEVRLYILPVAIASEPFIEFLAHGSSLAQLVSPALQGYLKPTLHSDHRIEREDGSWMVTNERSVISCTCHTFLESSNLGQI